MLFYLAKPQFEILVCSDGGSSLVVVASVADVWLGARAWDSWCGSEMSLGLSVLGSSKEEGVRTYYNILIRILGDTKERDKCFESKSIRVYNERYLPVGARRTS